MKILSYRTGFAANSSSIHSPMIVENINDVIEERFGQGFYVADFVIKNKNSLLEYLGAQINRRINSEFRSDPQTNKIIIDGLLGVELFKNNADYSIDKLYVQEMAGWILPHKKACNKNIPNLEYISDLKRYLLNENIIIWGINCNYRSKMNQKSKNDFSNLKINRSNLIERISDNSDNAWFSYKEDGVWRLFNTYDGTKIRLTMDGKDNIKYSTTPELIDLIISNKCENECNYCYRNCSYNGAIAQLSDIERILMMISATNTSEVAIGGGDILLYPELDRLIYLINQYSSYDIMFNTTLDIKSLRNININTNLLKKIAHSFKSIAISVSNIDDVYFFLKHFYAFMEENKCIISFQIIPELIISLDEIEKICRCNFNDLDTYTNFKTTLLGFKAPINCSSLPREVSDAINRTKNEEFRKGLSQIVIDNIDYLQCDTQFLKNFPEIQNFLTKGTYETEEGAFSCCINAINQTLYKSSYQLESPYLLYHKEKEKNPFFIYPSMHFRYGNTRKTNPILRGFNALHKNANHDV